jgi:hypothetical protein
MKSEGKAGGADSCEALYVGGHGVQAEGLGVALQERQSVWAKGAISCGPLVVGQYHQKEGKQPIRV